MKHYKIIKIFLLIVVNTIVILEGTHAEHMPIVKSKPVEGSEKDVFPDLLFFASYLYQ
ncbi:MAG TPA: hypothetical protein VK492_14035 [Chitinophagaceae bacterium]|jgi:hypothetical protein|nr:hypothetical protein [Chitinophagaceae bacterium]